MGLDKTEEKFTPYTEGFNIGEDVEILYPPFIKGCKGKIIDIRPNGARKIEICESNDNRRDYRGEKYNLRMVTSLRSLSILPEELFEL